jgi:hypothetical protein
MAVEAYSVLDLEFNPHLKLDRGHTITIVIHDGDNHTRDELYIDSYQIHPSNWCYDSKRYKTDRTNLRYRQRPTTQQNLYLAGMLAFDTKRNVGIGIMYFGKAKRGVHIERVRARSGNLSAIVGSYNLQCNNTKFGQAHIHPKGLIINGRKASSFDVKGNRVSWKGSDEDHCIHQDGFMEFSKNGRQIIKSSFGATGRKQDHKLPRKQPRNLDLQELLNMDPYDGDGHDTVQQAAMGDFNILIEYYMKEEWRKAFISEDPIELEPYLNDIAQDDGAGGGDGPNKTYYQTLSVPFLSYALSKVDHDDVGKLNYIRADKVLKKKMKDSDVDIYNRHTGKLYAYYWMATFQGMDKYVKDQANTNYDSTIDKMRNDWKDEVKEDSLGALDDDAMAEMLEMIDEFADIAKKEKLYWAYAMLHYLCDPEYINELRFIITSTPALIDDIQRDHERFCSVMSVLDPSSFLPQNFAMVMELFNLVDMIPKETDIAKTADLDFFAQKILEEFIDKYQNSSGEKLAEAAKAINDIVTADDGWENMMSIFNQTCEKATSWPIFWDNLSMNLLIQYGDDGSPAGHALGSASYAYVLQSYANEMIIDWDGMDAYEKAHFIKTCCSATAFVIKIGINFVDYAPRMWDACKELFYKNKEAITMATKVISSALQKLLIKCGATKVAQSLTIVENIADMLPSECYTKFYKTGGKFSRFMSTKVAGVLALAGIIFSSIDIARSETPLEVAMNSMFLLSSILDVVAIAAKVAVSKGILVIGGSSIGTLAVTTIASIAGGLSMAALIVGVVIMIFMFFKPKEPPDPIRDFVMSDEVKREGLYMALEATLEYFAVQLDDDDESKEIGVTLTTDNRNFMHVDNNGNITFKSIDLSYHTVFTVAIDEFGVTTITTKVIDGDDENVLHLTVNDDNSVNMQRRFSDDEEREKQMWTVDITGNINKVDKELISANFTIYNEQKKVYVRSDGSNISVGSSPQDWTVKLEYMKPDEIHMPNVRISHTSHDRSFSSYLAQSGSSSGRKFTISPSLPDFLEFDEVEGAVKQKEGVAPDVMDPTPFTISASNPHGNANSVEFTIEVVRTI